jgi:hypothetical protein
MRRNYKWRKRKIIAKRVYYFGTFYAYNPQGNAGTFSRELSRLPSCFQEEYDSICGMAVAQPIRRLTEAKYFKFSPI